MKYETATLYTASYIIARQADKIAFVLRKNTLWMNDYYGLPSGKVEKGESFKSAATREADEEIGVKIKPKNLRHCLTMHRNEPDEDMTWVDVYFEALEWEGDIHNAEPHMHKEVASLDPENLPENVIPSVRFALEAIETGKTYIEYGWE